MYCLLLTHKGFDLKLHHFFLFT